jgi:hypothetical protein
MFSYAACVKRQHYRPGAVVMVLRESISPTLCKACNCGGSYSAKRNPHPPHPVARGIMSCQSKRNAPQDFEAWRRGNPARQSLEYIAPSRRSSSLDVCWHRSHRSFDTRVIACLHDRSWLLAQEQQAFSPCCVRPPASTSSRTTNLFC